MTIVIGLMDKQSRRTYLACDGATTSDSEIFDTSKDKLIKVSKDFIIGVSGNTSTSTVLESNLDLLIKNIEDSNFVIQFRKNILEIFEKERIKLRDDNCIDNNFVIAYKNKLYWASNSIFCHNRHIFLDNKFEITSTGCANAEAKAYLSALLTYSNLLIEESLIETIEYCKKVDHFITPSTKTTIKYIDW